MEINVGDYVRTKDGIIKRVSGYNPQKNNPLWETLNGNVQMKGTIKNHSKDIIDLIEYMDLLVIENPVKLYDKNIEVSLFNPVRCDGFTTYEDGIECIILYLDYIVNIKDLKIKQVLTHEQFEANAYTIEKER